MHLFATDITDGFYKVLKAFTQIPTSFGVGTAIDFSAMDDIARKLLEHDSVEGAAAAMSDIPDMQVVKVFSNDASRNGPAYRYNYPFIVTYTDPLSRVLQAPARKPNPFFHLYEALWMLAGRDDVASPAMFAKQIKEYSDDGKTLNGAYGFRWRSAKSSNEGQCIREDQISHLVEHLKANRNSRRAVLQMWNIDDDLLKINSSKDVCCNTHCYFIVTDGKLDITVCNRSNDIIWGMLGSNYVTFSILLEYVALSSGLTVGNYSQITNNAHVYTDKYPLETLANWVKLGEVLPKPPTGNHVPLVRDPEVFNQELLRFVDNPFNNKYYDEPFFHYVAQPMMLAWKQHKLGNKDLCIQAVERIEAQDWKFNCKVWIMQHQKSKVK